MKIGIAQLKSLTPYSQSKYHETPRLPRELDSDYEKRTWREHLHYDENENIFIPGIAFSNALKEAAQYLSISVPGKGKSTYTKHFESGVLVHGDLILDIKKSDAQPEWLHLNSDGRRGGGRRVMRCYPRIMKWAGEVVYLINDDILTKGIFEKVLMQCGTLIGIGRWRPRNRGMYGSFLLEFLEWIDNHDEAMKYLGR